MVRWSVIASQLPGRTDNDVKNYWNTKLKKKLAKINSPNPFSTAPPPPAAVPVPPPPITEAYCHGFPPLIAQGYAGISTNSNINGVSEFGASPNSTGQIVSISDQGAGSSSTSDHNQATGVISYVSYLSGTGGGEEDGVLMDFGMGNLPYDIINGFWFQEKSSSSNIEVAPGLSGLDIHEFPSYLNIKPQGSCQTSSTSNQY